MVATVPRIAGIGSDVTGPETLPRSSSNRQVRIRMNKALAC